MTNSAPLLRWIQLCGRRPRLILGLTLLIALLSGLGALTLKINTNQLEMLDADAPEVTNVEHISKLIGGAGRLTLALRGSDPLILKQAAVKLAAQLQAREKERVRSITYRLPTDFILRHAPLFMETEDLKELRKRVRLKLADIERRADPFFFEIEETQPVELKVDDLLNKYARVGKKSVADDFFLSAPSEDVPGYMVLLHIKPRWDSNELPLTGALVADIRAWLNTLQLPVTLTSSSSEPKAATSKTQETTPSNAQHTLNFQEDYSTDPASTPTMIEFGFTGTYQTNYDDSFQIKESLAPVSVFAFLGVLGTLLLFFRKRLFSIVLIISGLLLGLMITFGWTALTIGELNMITSILGGILMGLGIDFGIHLLYRLRDELARHEQLEEALAVTLRGAGFASFISGLGTIAAFVSLLSSDFKGFSQFGFLAGSGVLLIGLTMYLWVPALVMWVERGAPGRARRLLGVPAFNALDSQPTTPTPTSDATSPSTATHRALPRPRLILLMSGLITLGLSLLAPRAPFEFNTRALMIEGIPSVTLQDEMNARFAQATDPVAVYTPTREAATEVYQYFKERLPSRPDAAGTPTLRTVDQVVGLDSFLPPMVQQTRNVEVLKGWDEELKVVKPEKLPQELQRRWPDIKQALKAQPFTQDDLPTTYRIPFESQAEATPGYITYVYPGVDLWDGKEMIAFAQEVRDIPVESGTYHAAGMPLIFSLLAQIILRDGQLTVLFTFIALLFILAIDLRRISDVLIGVAPLALGVGSMLGLMSLINAHLNLMNIVVFPIIIGYSVSHGVYLIHRVREGVTPREALASVGRAIACSTLTTLAGWAALFAAPHRGLQSMGMLACLGMLASLFVSFTLMPALLELLRTRQEKLNRPVETMHRT